MHIPMLFACAAGGPQAAPLHHMLALAAGVHGLFLLAARPVATEHGRVAVTASMGLTTWVGTEPCEAALQRADQAMYRAKNHGRNRVEVLVPVPVVAPVC